MVFGCPPLGLRMTDFQIFIRVSLQTFTTSIQLNKMQVGGLVNQRWQIVLYVNARSHVSNMILQRGHWFGIRYITAYTIFTWNLAHWQYTFSSILKSILTQNIFRCNENAETALKYLLTHISLKLYPSGLLNIITLWQEWITYNSMTGQCFLFWLI